MKPSPQPIRLVELPSRDDPASLARLVRSAKRAPAEPVPQLKARLRGSLRRKAARRQRAVRAALLGALVLLAGGVMAAVAQPLLRRWQERRVASSAAGDFPRQEARARPRGPASPARAANEESLASPDPASVSANLAPTHEPAEASPVAFDPSARLNAPLPARAAPTAAQPSRAPVKPPVDSAARPSRPREPLRTAMLDPPPWPSEHRPPERSMQAAPSPSLPSAGLAPKPSSSPRPEGVVPLAAPGSTGLPAPSPPPPRAASSVLAPLATPVHGEQTLLTRAIRSLRSEHQPGSALAVLDEYLARFPNGNLRPEAIRLRTEALLALGHKPAALAELNREPAPGGAGREETHLVRGELHAAAGRWREAFADFDSVVRAFAGSDTAMASLKLRERFERALWGRASARSHLGDQAGARADLRECLRRFPQGRFAGQTAHLLGELR